MNWETIDNILYPPDVKWKFASSECSQWGFYINNFVLYIVERIKNKLLLVGKRLLVLKLFEQGNWRSLLL